MWQKYDCKVAGLMWQVWHTAKILKSCSKDCSAFLWSGSTFSFVWRWWSTAVRRGWSVSIFTTIFTWSRAGSVSSSITWSVIVPVTITAGRSTIATFDSHVDTWCWTMSSFRYWIINSNLMTVNIKTRSIFLGINSIFNIFKCNKTKSSWFISLLIVDQIAFLQTTISFKNSSKLFFSGAST